MLFYTEVLFYNKCYFIGRCLITFIFVIMVNGGQTIVARAALSRYGEFNLE